MRSHAVTVVMKPGKMHLGLDVRKVNSVTVKDAYSMPFIRGMISRHQKARFIICLDLSDSI